MSKQEELVIKAQKRSVTGKKVNAMRRQGILPGVVYGHKLEATPIQMDHHSVSLQLGKVTPTTLVKLDIDGKEHQVFVRDRQIDVIYGKLLHVDFLAVSMDEKMRTAVDIILSGEAPVLKTGEAIINQNLNALEIECLPQDMPERIEMDLSGINSIEDMITVADLDINEKVTVLADPTEVVVSVSYLAQEEKAEEEEVEVEEIEEPEVLEKGKKEEEEE